MIRVIDLFAGPGGLGEGFSAFKDQSVFDIVLSIEKDPWATETLKLRTFFRLFQDGVPEEYYCHLRQEIRRDTLYEKFPGEASEASKRCWQAQLGPGGISQETVRRRIDNALGKAAPWVLIGGPPCQAYSLAGRARNKGKPGYDPNTDIRQRLYVEYLQILADHCPAVFIMENVKGLLSAKVDNSRLFHCILEDLRNPADALKREGRISRRQRPHGYRILSLVEKREFENGNLDGAVIQAEEYGIPQARHRVILMGVRNDLSGAAPRILKRKPPVFVSDVIGSLPPLRSRLSRIRDSATSWEGCLRAQIDSRWANAGTAKADSLELSKMLRKVLASISTPVADFGREFILGQAIPNMHKDWYCDSRLGGICNHTSRAHIEKDLFRYVYAACYAELHRKSPKLENFPTDLLPNHTSVESAIHNGRHFSDRFRVQMADKPSTTIMSHISKDGHYYIHPDPYQCRSLTAREAARLQTFPDNYFFCGPRTEQYIQIGNAVPPLLAKQIAEIVQDILIQGGAND